MSCEYASPTDEFHGWRCSVTDGECMFLFPSSKACAEKYGEGPDAPQDKCENCNDFYLENDKRCCKSEPLAWDDKLNDAVKSKYIDNVICCGGYKPKGEGKC